MASLIQISTLHPLAREQGMAWDIGRCILGTGCSNIWSPLGADHCPDRVREGAGVYPTEHMIAQPVILLGLFLTGILPLSGPDQEAEG